uniref:Uncharacterized protein n=1 Tax=Solanum tuberosum TaxID=4113 RepID=M1BZ33_SOLTU
MAHRLTLNSITPKSLDWICIIQVIHPETPKIRPRSINCFSYRMKRKIKFRQPYGTLI